MTKTSGTSDAGPRPVCTTGIDAGSLYSGVNTGT